MMQKGYKDIFSSLRDTQEQLWKELDNLSGFAFSKDLDKWHRDAFQQMNAWAEKAVAQSLELQNEWLGQWSERAGIKKLKPKLFADLSTDASASMQRWLDNQKQLWDQWLRLVRESGNQSTTKSLGEWQKTLEDSFERQMNLMQDWGDWADFKKMSPKDLTKLSDQIEKLMQQWIDTQKQLWDHWFAALTVAASSTAPAKKRTTATSRPAAAKKAAKPKPAAASKDDLKVISGIGPGLEKQLNAQGITSVSQIAKLDDDAVASLDAAIKGVGGRIKRGNWIEQAKKLTAKK